MTRLSVGVLFGDMCLSNRGSFDLLNLWDDPRGLTGSELGFFKIAQGFAELGHDVSMFSRFGIVPVSFGGSLLKYAGCAAQELGQARSAKHDVWISINEPDLLRDVSGMRVCEFWLNEFSFCKVAFDEHVDLFVSPSAAHRRMCAETWRDVEVTSEGPRAQYRDNPAKWTTIPLGCDLYGEKPVKVPGRVVYCSSPDRGLHRLLEAWPAIKRSVPHATLRIFYRLQPWIDGFRDTPFFPPIERLRARALYVQEALRRMSAPEWGITVCDSVSRNQIARELGEAEVFAYPVDTVSWSEGFSCATLEACAAQACPIITDCDALGEIYSFIRPTSRGNWPAWQARVIEALTNPGYRDEINKEALRLAERMTWKHHVEKLEREILSRL